MTWRLVDSDLSSPSFTAAADEAIALALSKGMVRNTLHFYRRDRPTVSLGYFRSASEDIDLDFCKANDIQVVRRASGGSSIYTDPNHLIYGLAVKDEEVPRDKIGSYEKVCSALIFGLGILGLEADFKPVNDVLVGGRKISGSAQMRRRGIVLQHGTIILASEPEKMFGALKATKTPNITSLEEELGSAPAVEVVKKALVRGFEETFEVKFEREELTDFERDRIEELIAEKYGSEEWNFRR